MYEANKTLYTQIANRVGYHFVIKNVKRPIQIVNGQTFTLETSILNKGVTNVYQNYKLAVAFLNTNGQVVQKKFLTDVNPRTWNSDVMSTQTSQVLFNGIAVGNYQLALGLFSSQEDADPSISFGNTQKTANGWYVISTSINFSNN
jgi:hypothetical protein